MFPLYIYLENYIFNVPPDCIYLESGYALYLITNLQIIKLSDFTNMDYECIMERMDYGKDGLRKDGLRKDGLYNEWIMDGAKLQDFIFFQCLYTYTST